MKIATMADARLVPSGVAARAIGVDISTLNRWWQAGTVAPALVTAGGHARWDVDDLRAQLRAMRERADDD